jgi:methyl-accepting chemotaxis protein
MEQDPKLTVTLVLVAVAVLLQAGVMVGILLAILKVRREIEGIRADVKQRLDPVAQSLTEIVASSREPIRLVLANLAESSRTLRERIGQLDRVVADLVDRSRLQVIRVDQLISGLLQKVESTAETIQRQILAPIQEVSAVVKGVRSGLEFLFSRRRPSRVSEAAPDEQMFI